jgi:hypothetical protein
MYYPRELEHSNVGGNLASYTYPVINGTPKMVVASGGNAKTGGCILYVLVE